MGIKRTGREADHSSLDVYIRSPIYLHRAELNQLSTRTNLLYMSCLLVEVSGKVFLGDKTAKREK
jgi:hypothetical protein